MSHAERGIVQVMTPGLFTTVQDYPGRLGYWAVGVPPSGPMDDLSFRLGNRLLGNPEGAPGLEITSTGPTLHFAADAMICLTGAPMAATLDGTALEYWTPTPVPAGGILRIGRLTGAGWRTYLLFRGGLTVPHFLSSASTFTLGGFGGVDGRTLRAGDRLDIAPALGDGPELEPLPIDLRPSIRRDWHIGVMYGPHGAPDYFTEEDIEEFFSSAWKVHHNSARTGVRLVGPKPRWARPDGGEAGLHPSNIHDNAYAVGSVDFTGDMPVILGPDGPSLGGFVCPAVVVRSQLWKLGQFAPGDRVRFVAIPADAADTTTRMQDEAVRTLDRPSSASPVLRTSRKLEAPVLRQSELAGGTAVTIRSSGDRHLLIELGPNVLDLELRFRIHALQESLEERLPDGVIDLTPGVRSLQIHFDGRRLARRDLMRLLDEVLAAQPIPDEIEVPSRAVRLPLSWDDPAVQQTVLRYMSSVRADAPWCPSNIEFIRRINGLDSIDDVRRIIFDASYLVMGLGDVYLGAPVATPLDPRHRLVTTKYNPARTWTPPNVVGIGGAYLCVYGMEGPGGYQLFGRTLQMWNTHQVTEDFVEGKPWLLRSFDRLSFYPVSHEELMDIRADFPSGGYRLATEANTFKLAEYRRFLTSIEDEAEAVRLTRQAAFDEERTRWMSSGEFDRRVG